MKEKFDIQYWLNYNPASGVSTPQASKTKNLPVSTGPGSVPPFTNDTETILSRIEASCCDLTGTYQDWVKIGFAFANEYGEGGRGYFHRVSSQYPRYSASECDKQYSSCLKDNGKGVTIKSFFYLCEQAGIDINCSDSTTELVTPELVTPELVTPSHLLIKPEGELMTEQVTENSHQLREQLSVLPAEVYANLPAVLRECCTLFHEGIEQDVLLLSVLGVIGSCLPKVEGYYFNNPLTPHIYLFITAPAASGKGIMKWSKFFGQTIHDHLIEQSRNAKEEYEMELELYENLKKGQKLSGQKPQEPSRSMLFIPANSSSSAFIQALDENNHSGIIFETEADSMAKASRQDWGDSSDLFRNAFEHEGISMYRRKDKEYLEIKDPHLSIVLSGTPKQVSHIMPEVENGLFSRFLYYKFEDHGGFKNPFVSPSNLNYNQFFSEKGKYIFDIWQALQKRTHPIIFKLKREQETRFTQVFDQMLIKGRLLVGNDFDANIKRLGIIHFRIAMILSVLRMFEDGEQLDSLICSDQDFETAMTLVTTLEKHAIAVYENLDNNNLKGRQLAFFDKLPEKFTRQDYLAVAAGLNIKDKSADYYINQFKGKLIKHDEHNNYTKLTN